MKLKNKLFYAFIATYFVFLLVNVSPYYLDADEGSHALTSVFFSRFYEDFFSSPTFSLRDIYNYAKAYYVRYPKFSFIYGPVFPLIMGAVLLLTGPSIAVIRIVEALLGTATLIVFYYALRNWYDENVSLLATALLGTSGLFVTLSLKVMLDIPCFFFYMLGFYFFTKKRYFYSGLFLGLSILTKEIALVFSGALLIAAMTNYKKVKFKGLLLMCVGIAVFVLPYFALLYFTQGGLDVVLRLPLRQQYYGISDSDPQWYELYGWIYPFVIIANNFSLIFVLALIPSLYYVFKHKNFANKTLLALFLVMYLSVVFFTDKNEKFILLGTGFCAAITSIGLNKMFKYYASNKARFAILFATVLMMVASVPADNSKPEVPMSNVAEYLVNNCKNCTILVASEVGSVYDSYLLYESFVRDKDATLRFIRPTIFSSVNAKEAIENNSVSKVIVIGDYDFIKRNEEIKPYLNNVEYVINKYDVAKVYDSDIVGKIIIYDTKIAPSQKVPMCFTALAINKSFCTEFLRPKDALKSL